MDENIICVIREIRSLCSPPLGDNRRRLPEQEIVDNVTQIISFTCIYVRFSFIYVKT